MYHVNSILWWHNDDVSSHSVYIIHAVFSICDFSKPQNAISMNYVTVTCTFMAGGCKHLTV